MKKATRSHELVRVILDPVDQERVLQLEMHRMREFYRVSLSDSIAYLEVDLDSDRLKSAGGLWSGYDKKYDRKMGSLLKFMLNQIEAHIDDGIRPLIEADTWRDILSKEETIHRFRYLRWLDDEWRWVDLVARSFREPNTNNMFALLNLKDVDDQVRREQAQREAADHDPLTGVYNRSGFEKRVREYMEVPENNRCGLIILLDLDNFKEINDTRGHLEGDSALQYLTRLLEKVFRTEDVVGRLGGDEFLVFLKGHVTKKMINTWMNQLYTELAAHPGYPLSCSAGLVRVSSKNFSYLESLNSADTALYASKQTGKRQYTFAYD